MRIALRYLAMMMACIDLGLATLLVLHVRDLVRSEQPLPAVLGAVPVLLVFLAYVTLGAFATVRLWQLKESGRRTAIGFLAILALPPLAGGSIDVFAFFASPVVFLLLPLARRACLPPSTD
jgi:hypothetical protein